MGVNCESVVRNPEREPAQFSANEFELTGDDHEVSICGKQRIAIDVNRQAAD
jgi:hypothetical protein